MNGSRKRAIILGLLVVGIGIYIFQFQGATVEAPIPDVSAGVRTYSSGVRGISFSYPDRYILEEKDLGSPQRTLYSIVLTEDTEENRFLREGTSPAREGPVSITITSYQNDLDHYDVERWMTSTSYSNFKLSPGTYTEASVGGERALSYSWSGLYEADTLVVARPDYVHAFTVTYTAPDEGIRKDFESLMKTVVFE